MVVVLTGTEECGVKISMGIGDRTVIWSVVLGRVDVVKETCTVEACVHHFVSADMPTDVYFVRIPSTVAWTMNDSDWTSTAVCEDYLVI